MNAPIDYQIDELLEKAGAVRPRCARGKWICPRHTGSPSLSVNSEKGVFNCHHTGCDFHGGFGTLLKSLGIRRTWRPRAEYARLCQGRERAHEAAERLYAAVHYRQLDLRQEFRSLGRLEQAAHVAGTDHPGTWGALALCYRRREPLLRELDTLENCSASEAVAIIGEGYEGSI